MIDYSKLKLVVLDVDGTLTDGGIYYDSQGNEMKRFDVKDGLGIKLGMAAGLEFAIITGRVSPMVERRVKELGIQHLVQGAQKKAPALRELMASCGFEPDQVAYMGDDLNDLPAMKLVGICACPVDADDMIREMCAFVSECPGGHGAVRDFIQTALQARGQWKNLTETFYF